MTDPSASPDGSVIPDDALLLRVRERDEAAFAELLSRHLGPIHTYLLRMTRSREQAQDLAQETFLRVWQKASAYKPGKVQATTWLHRIAHNLCVDGFRRHSAESEAVAASASAGGASGVQEMSDSSSDPFLQHSASETRDLLLDALDALPENQRAAFTLCQIQGFSNAQAADIMVMNVRAVESLLARARRTLREALEESTRVEETDH